MPRAKPLAWVPCRCGCGEPAVLLDHSRGFLRGYKRGHHQRDPEHTGHRSTPGRYPKLTREEFFWWRTDMSDPLNCWEWTGKRNVGGYGVMHVADGQFVAAHRFSYELHNGPIPDGLTIDHLCRNRACVRPDHLEPVTIGENVRRGLAVRHGRYSKEPANG